MILYKISPDIIGVCKTKLNKNSNFEYVLMKNYTSQLTNSMSKAGGVGIYDKNSLVYTPKN